MPSAQRPIAVYLEVGQKKTFAGALDWPGWCRSGRDAAAFGVDERERAEAILAAIWRAFNRAVAAADGKELRRGPRGGGRQSEAIVRHLLDADAAYLRNVAQQFKVDADAPLADEVQRARAAIRAALRAGERGEIPERGPRGGKIWTPRSFVRRLAWHTLDHAWEIEDRIV